MSDLKPAIEQFRVPRLPATLRHGVTESIRQAICAGRFAAGDRLPERRLCEMTGVSRTLVREALRQLESEGLIEVVAQRGPIVSRITADQAVGIYQVREALEGLAAQLFAEHASDADRDALRNALKKLTTAAGPEKRLAAKNEFYGALIAGARNEALGKSLQMLNSRTMVLRGRSLQAPNRWKHSLREIEALVAALDERDSVNARRLAMEHVRYAAAAAMTTFSIEAQSLSAE